MADVDLARRAVASPRWRWKIGMIGIVDGVRMLVMEVNSEDAPSGWRGIPSLWRRLDGQPGMAPFGVYYGSLTPGWCASVWDDALPDLTDSATLGCILALYLDARSVLAAPDPVLTLAAVYGLRDPRTVEALVAALVDGLESAP